MDLSSDYSDLLKLFNKDRVKYLLVGAYAVIFYTEPRYTKDLDLWVEPDQDNARKVFRALGKFGAPLKGISSEDFTKKGMIYQIGVAPVRIDVLMDIGGIAFAAAWKNRRRSVYAGVPINVIGLAELKKAKIAANRPQDRLDLEKLEKL